MQTNTIEIVVCCFALYKCDTMGPGKPGSIFSEGNYTHKTSRWVLYSPSWYTYKDGLWSVTVVIGRLRVLFRLLTRQGAEGAQRDLGPFCFVRRTMVSRSARCEMCYELVGDNGYEVWEDYSVYCHNPDWCIPGGTCWEKRICEDVPEMKPWLWLLFECEGCQPDEFGECSCNSRPLGNLEERKRDV